MFRSQGIGEALVKRSLEAAKAAGWKLVILVGDEPYYARMGFQRAPKGHISLPGPVDPERLLYCELEPGALAPRRGRHGGAAAPDAPKASAASRVLGADGSAASG